MISRDKLKFKRGDIFAAAAILILAAVVMACFIPRGSGDAAAVEVYMAGELVKTVSLSQDTEFDIVGKYTNTVTVRDGTAAITASDCPGADCVHSGAISSAARSIVCLPNGVEIRITAADDEVDFVVG